MNLDFKYKQVHCFTLTYKHLEKELKYFKVFHLQLPIYKILHQKHHILHDPQVEYKTDSQCLFLCKISLKALDQLHAHLLSRRWYNFVLHRIEPKRE